MRKRPIKALLTILLAALCLLNTLTAVAVEAEKTPPADPPAVTDSVTDSGQPASPEESEPVPKPDPEDIPDSAPPGASGGGTEPPKDSIPEEPPLVWAEVGTFEDLYEALEASSSRETTRIRLTSNITVPAVEEYTSSADHSIELDLGPYTLYVEGSLMLQIGLTVTGGPGEDALIRVRPSGRLYINDVEIQAGDRYAVWQEEGAAFIFKPLPDFSGNIHFADKDVAMPHSFLSWKVAMPVAVVHDGQTLADELPDTDSVYLYRNDGTGEPEYDIAVDWDVGDYQTELDTRTRTLITGSYPDAIALYQPVCLVVFQNGNPATFLDTYGTESYGWPKAKVKIELMQPELGCRFEWSQDGENWLPADAVETPTWDGRLAFSVSFPQETPPTYPYYLSAAVDYPDGNTGYSDVIVIRESNGQCDSGGNRHGGTGVTPPELPPIGGGSKEDDNGMDGVAPGKPEGSDPPEDGEKEKPPVVNPPVVNPPVVNPPAVNPPVVNLPAVNDTPEQSSPPAETPGQSDPPAGSKPPAQATPPVIRSEALPLAADPPAAVNPTSPHAGQTGDETAASETSSARPDPPPSASPQAPDTALIPDPQTTADVQEARAPVVAKPEPPAKDGGAPSTKTMAQVAVGVIATGGIITLTMTWGSWSKRLVGLLRKLLKR